MNSKNHGIQTFKKLAKYPINRTKNLIKPSKLYTDKKIPFQPKKWQHLKIKTVRLCDSTKLAKKKKEKK